MNSSRSNPYAAQRVQMPYGDAFIVNTPAIDRASNLIYTEQKQREANQALQNQKLDDEFGKNLTNIRDKDVPDLTKKYTDYKSAWIKLQQNKNPTAEDQLDLLRKKVDVSSFANLSQNQRKKDEEDAKGMIANPDKYEDGAHDKLIKSINTPYLQLGDMKNYDYSYKGTDTDFQKILSTAQGVSKPGNPIETPFDNGLQTKITSYSFGATPAQFKDSILSSLALHKAGRDAAALISQVTPEQMQAVNDKFNAIPLTKWKQMGIDNPQNLEPLNPNNKGEQFASYQAKLYAINNEPKEGMPAFRDNKSAEMAAKNAHDFQMERMRSGDAIAKQNLEHRYQQLKNNSDFAYTDKTIENYANTGQPVQIITPAGEPLKGIKLPLTQELTKALEVDKKIPSSIVMSEDRQTIYPIYQKFAGVKDGKNTYEVDEKLSQPIPRRALQMGIYNSGKKGVGVEFDNSKRVATSSSNTKSSGSHKAVTVKGL